MNSVFCGIKIIPHCLWASNIPLFFSYSPHTMSYVLSIIGRPCNFSKDISGVELAVTSDPMDAVNNGILAMRNVLWMGDGI